MPSRLASTVSGVERASGNRYECLDGTAMGKRRISVALMAAVSASAISTGGLGHVQSVS